MSILIIASFAESLLSFRGALIAALLARGVTVHVVAPGLRPGSEVYEALSRRGVQVHDVPMQRTGMNPAADLHCLLSLWRLMRRVRPDGVLAYTIKPVVYGLLAARLAGVTRRCALITGLGYAFSDEAQAGTLRRLAQGLYRFALRGAYRVFFQNPDDEALFHRLGILGADAASRVVDGSGVDVDYFSATPVPAQSRFLLIARLLGAKGVREYAQAAALLRRQYPTVVFGLVGWVDDNPDAITRAELDAWVSGGTIEYLGRLDDVRPAIAACSVYVLPSYREGTPRSVLEAMAMGRAIVTTDAPGCRETVVDEGNGLLVSVRSVPELAAAMRRFIEEPGLAERMGARSREIAVDRYDVDKVNAVMLREMGVGGEPC